jgi:CRP-like cAMP-binding protein
LTLVPLWRSLAELDEGATAPVHQVELLRSVPIFAHLAPARLERLAKALVDVRVEPGQAVFEEGDRGDRFYVVERGSAVVEAAGNRLREVAAGDFFGEIALLRDVPRTAGVRATSELALLALERDIFLATVSGDPASAEAAGSIVAARLPSPVIT